MTAPRYELVLTPPARRAISDTLLEPVAVTLAVIDFRNTALPDNPRRVGKPLRDDLAGIWSARRGTYHVLSRIREDPRELLLPRVEHRLDANRPLPRAAGPVNGPLGRISAGRPIADSNCRKDRRSWGVWRVARRTPRPASGAAERTDARPRWRQTAWQDLPSGIAPVARRPQGARFGDPTGIRAPHRLGLSV